MIKSRIWYSLIGGIKTKIEGPAVLRLPPGGTLSLQCTISRLNLPPKNLHWKHESTVLTSRTRPGVSLESEKLSGESNTKLVIVDLKSSDEGTYQCVTDASRPATVRLFIGKIRKVSPWLIYILSVDIAHSFVSYYSNHMRMKVLWVVLTLFLSVLNV